jgi:hypothetical protein
MVKQSKKPAGFDIRRFDLTSIEEVAKFADVAAQSVRYWLLKGMPRTQTGNGKLNACTYNAADIFRWYRTEGPGAPRRGSGSGGNGSQSLIPLGVDESELLSGPDTPALERFRLARARLSELEYERQKSTVVPIEEMVAEVSGLAGHLRKLGEQLGQHFGPDAQRMLNDALAEYRDMARKKFGNLAGPIAVGGDDGGQDDSGGDVADRPSDEPVGGRGNLDTDWGAQGEAVFTQSSPGEPDLVS